MKILIGVVGALVIALALVGWRFAAALDREGRLAESLSAAQGALEQAETQNRQLANRFDSFDAAVKGLQDDQRKNQGELKIRLANLTKIVKEPGDTDAQITCLHTPVPAGLDRSLREPAGPVDADPVPERVSP